MTTRFRLGFSVVLAAIAAAVAAPAQGAITVFGGGLGRSCYEAVEFARVSNEKALDICTLAITQESMTRRDKAATYTNRGILRMRDGQLQRAMADYERSLALMPLLETKVNLGAALYGLKRYPEALTALNEGVLTDSTDAKAIGFYNRALTYEKLGNVQAAYDDFRNALATNPEFELAAKQLERFTVVEQTS